MPRAIISRFAVVRCILTLLGRAPTIKRAIKATAITVKMVSNIVIAVLYTRFSCKKYHSVTVKEK